MWGHWRFLAIYLVAAFGGSCLAMMSKPAICIGASGAVCGIFAALAGWLFFNRQHLTPPLFRAWQRNFLINVVLLVLISFVPRVSWEGHLGGAIAGLAVALCFTYFQSQSGWLRWLQWAAVILVPLVSFGLLVKTMNTSAAWGEVRSEVEIHAVEHVYLPSARASERQAMQLVQKLKLDDILGQRANRRDSDKVEEAIHSLNTAIALLDGAADELNRAGPFRTPSVEEARRVRLKDLETRIKLWQLARECMEKGEDWTEKDEERLRQQADEMKQADKEWQALLR